MRDGRVVVYLYILLIITMVCYVVNQHLVSIAEAEETIELQHETILILQKENSELRSFIDVYLLRMEYELEQLDVPIHNRLI